MMEHLLENIEYANITPRTESLMSVLDAMEHNLYSPLLAGETGIGKTSFVKQLSILLGIDLLIIEIPHLVEEHVVQIPFIEFSKSSSKTTAGIQLDLTKPNITIATSYLASTLKKMHATSDSDYLQSISRFPKEIKKMWESLGGTNTTIPQDIKNIREKYHAILFLDEYWRVASSQQVRNILRSILDGAIGDDPMPHGIFPIFASNLFDKPGTIETPELNAPTRQIDLAPPTKKELLSLLFARHKVDKRLLKAFNKVLDDSHISYNDEANDIRTSPRRWEQILLYLNANLPSENNPMTTDQARAILTNIKSMFSDEHGHISTLHDTVNRVVKMLLGEHGNAKTLPEHDWDVTLKNQIETKMKLGKKRSYVPVIAGPPGIGKTSIMTNIAHDENLLLLKTNAQTLSPESLLGIPLSQDELLEAANTKKSVSFTPSMLYRKIENEMQELTNNFLANPNIPEDKKQKWQNQKYKFLWFIDEFNRVSSPKVFNLLRRVILDKEFDHKHKVPDNIIIVAAMNPKSDATKRVHPLTGHMKDAVDIIHSKPSWTKWVNLLQNKIDKVYFPKVDSSITSTAKKIVLNFAEKFGKQLADYSGDDSRQFYLNVTDFNKPYMSPRDYTDLYINLVSKIKRIYQNRLDPVKQINAAFVQTLNDVLRRNNIDSPHFLSLVQDWIESEYTNWLQPKETVAKLQEILDNCLENDVHLVDDPYFVQYMNKYDTNIFAADLINYFNYLVAQEQHEYDVFAKKTINKRLLDQGKIKIINDLVSKLDTIHIEIYHALETHELSHEIEEQFNRSISENLWKLIDGFGLPESEEVPIDDWLEQFSGWKWTNIESYRRQ